MEMEEAKMEIFPNIGRNDYPRSNARSRYRRPDAATRSGHIRRNIGRAANEKIAPSTFKERLIFQATICGGFLAVLLFFNIIDTDFTNGVTGWIEQNIAFDMLAEDGGVGDWVGSVLGIFGNDAEDNMLPYYEVHHDASTQENLAPVQIMPAPTPAPANTIDSSRIDENILREITGSGD